ncbi:MAG: hypothetical protein H6687_03115 [Bacillales bacterium]|nr:hypothetical protein [Bacillales bacterium]
MWYHGSYVTFFTGWSGGISLGLFVFVADVSMLARDKKTEDSIELAKDVQRQMLVHEYGHTIQSLMFGPLYFFVIGIPSVLWGTRKKHDRYRKNNNVKYTSYWTEKWANNLGEKITGEKAWDK